MEGWPTFLAARSLPWDALNMPFSGPLNFAVNLCMFGKLAEHPLVTFKRVLYFAIFAHAPPVSGQVSTKFMAWTWVMEYTEKFLNAPDDAKFDMRMVISGMADFLAARSLPWDALNMPFSGPLNFAVNLCMFGKLSPNDG